MARNLRHLAVHLALAAMVLRALLPAGWMPNVGHQSGPALILCNLDGGPALSSDHGTPSKHQPDGHGDQGACPFAAAPHLASAAALPAIGQSQVSQILVSGYGESQAPPALSGYAPQSPRAPPRVI
jgi:hypothetical protein